MDLKFQLELVPVWYLTGLKGTDFWATCSQNSCLLALLSHCLFAAMIHDCILSANYKFKTLHYNSVWTVHILAFHFSYYHIKDSVYYYHLKKFSQNWKVGPDSFSVATLHFCPRLSPDFTAGFYKLLNTVVQNRTITLYDSWRKRFFNSVSFSCQLHGSRNGNICHNALCFQLVHHFSPDLGQVSCWI